MATTKATKGKKTAPKKRAKPSVLKKKIKEWCYEPPIVWPRVEVITDVRELIYLVKKDPNDKNRVTGRGKKTMCDIRVITRHESGAISDEVFTFHVYKGEPRIIVPKVSKYDKQESMSLEEFTKYAARRWRSNAEVVLAAVPKVPTKE